MRPAQITNWIKLVTLNTLVVFDNFKPKKMYVLNIF